MRDQKITSTCLNIILIISILGFLGNEVGYSSIFDINPRDDSALARSKAAAPEIDITTWTLSINGSVSTPLNLTYAELRTLPAVTVFSELICVSGGIRIAEGNWTGVQLSYLLSLADITPQAVDMIFYAADGFSSSLPVTEILKRPDMILAYEKDGETLPIDLGYPVIVVAPGKWGYKWVKWVISIELSNTDYLGYWESVGYSDSADIPDYEIPPSVPNPSMGSETPDGLEITTSSTTQVEMTIPEFESISLMVLILIGLLIGGYKKYH